MASVRAAREGSRCTPPCAPPPLAAGGARRGHCARAAAPRRCVSAAARRTACLGQRQPPRGHTDSSTTAVMPKPRMPSLQASERVWHCVCRECRGRKHGRAHAAIAAPTERGLMGDAAAPVRPSRGCIACPGLPPQVTRACPASTPPGRSPSCCVTRRAAVGAQSCLAGCKCLALAGAAQQAKPRWETRERAERLGIARE